MTIVEFEELVSDLYARTGRKAGQIYLPRHIFNGLMYDINRYLTRGAYQHTHVTDRCITFNTSVGSVLVQALVAGEDIELRCNDGLTIVAKRKTHELPF